MAKNFLFWVIFCEGNIRSRLVFAASWGEERKAYQFGSLTRKPGALGPKSPHFPPGKTEVSGCRTAKDLLTDVPLFDTGAEEKVRMFSGVAAGVVVVVVFFGFFISSPPPPPSSFSLHAYFFLIHVSLIIIILLILLIIIKFVFVLFCILWFWKMKAFLVRSLGQLDVCFGVDCCGVNTPKHHFITTPKPKPPKQVKRPNIPNRYFISHHGKKNTHNKVVKPFWTNRTKTKHVPIINIPNHEHNNNNNQKKHTPNNKQREFQTPTNVSPRHLPWELQDHVNRRSCWWPFYRLLVFARCESLFVFFPRDIQSVFSIGFYVGRPQCFSKVF